jgi:hypothetical protein
MHTRNVVVFKLRIHVTHHESIFSTSVEPYLYAMHGTADREPSHVFQRQVSLHESRMASMVYARMRTRKYVMIWLLAAAIGPTNVASNDPVTRTSCKLMQPQFATDKYTRNAHKHTETNQQILTNTCMNIRAHAHTQAISVQRALAHRAANNDADAEKVRNLLTISTFMPSQA